MNINNCHELSTNAQIIETGIKPTIIYPMDINKNTSGIRNLAFSHSSYISQAPSLSWA